MKVRLLDQRVHVMTDRKNIVRVRLADRKCDHGQVVNDLSPSPGQELAIKVVPLIKFLNDTLDQRRGDS
ncbi:hypothetical protein D9M70_648170 [compost metagenome]